MAESVASLTSEPRSIADSGRNRRRKFRPNPTWRIMKNWNPSKTPAVPGTMAGYSGTPLPKKLGIRENGLVVLVNAPPRFERKLEPLSSGAKISEDLAQANVAVLFVKSQAELLRDFRQLAKSLPQKVALWIAWPKQASGVVTDIKEGFIREFGLGEGWVDYKVCAIDDTWSGLCFARRKK
jgi:hypothetical protein